jgi:hypothetical protein
MPTRLANFHKMLLQKVAQTPKSPYDMQHTAIAGDFLRDTILPIKKEQGDL